MFIVRTRKLDFPFSNWGEVYRTQGILAPGENILGATPGGGTAARSGTSFATPIVSGLVALLLSIQLQRGEKPDPHAIRDAILKTALPCNLEQGVDNKRCLVGTLNILGAKALITKEGIQQMSSQEEVMIQPSEVNNIEPEVANQITEPVIETPNLANLQVSTPSLLTMSVQPVSANLVTSSIEPSECATCAAGRTGPQLVYALGELGYDFATEARRDSFIQAIPQEDGVREDGLNRLLDYLDNNPWEAQSLIWTLNLDTTPIYAIIPSGAYASVVYDRLRLFIRDPGVERVSIPGYIGGNIRLLSGQTVPVIVPEVRGMYSWSVNALVESVARMADLPTEVSQEDLNTRIGEYLNRRYQLLGYPTISG